MSKLKKIAVVMPTKKGATEEKAFGKVLDAMQTAQDDIETLLGDVAKTKPMPKTLDEAVKARRTIHGSRAAELKDLEKSRKRNELHSNPSKLERLYKDLNEDIAQANWLEGGVSKAISEHYVAEEVPLMVAAVKLAIPDTVGSIGMKALVATFVAENDKQEWKSFDANKLLFIKEAKELGRVAGIKALRDHADFKTLQQGRRDSIINEAIKKTAMSVELTRTALEEKLEWQDKPDKARWANFLGLGAGGSYKLYPGGSYDGYKIHWTMSNDSWTAKADGKVSISANSADKLLKELLEPAGGLQLHATLEIGDSKEYPHIFLFAGVVDGKGKWPKALEVHRAAVLADKGQKAADKIKDSWVADAQKALTAVMDSVQKDLLAKLATAKSNGGSTF